MAQYTTNYNLTKIDLTDAPPDITVLNPNWDTIDETLKTIADNLQEMDFDELANKYGVTETYPDADTGTITATVGSGSPVTATRSTVVSEADGVTTYVETTTIDGEETVRTWTEGETTASMEVSAGD